MRRTIWTNFFFSGSSETDRSFSNDDGRWFCSDFAENSEKFFVKKKSAEKTRSFFFELRIDRRDLFSRKFCLENARKCGSNLRSSRDESNWSIFKTSRNRKLFSESDGRKKSDAFARLDFGQSTSDVQRRNDPHLENKSIEKEKFADRSNGETKSSDESLLRENTRPQLDHHR